MKTAIAIYQKLWQKLKPILSQKPLILLLLAIATSISIVIAQPVIAQSPISQSPETQTQSGKIVESANRLYAAGQLKEAIATYQTALKIYQDRQGSDSEKLSAQLNQALCLSYLAIAYQELGELPQAQSAIAQSSEILDKLSLSTKSAQRSLPG
jgi:tetratricopeptide (TPR) repeat protein